MSTDLNDDARARWDQIAPVWDARMGDTGNDFQRVLVGPASERLLAVQPGQVVLDIACGAGVFARRLADLGAQVVACDYSAAFIQAARARSGRYASRIEYAVVDATDEVALEALGAERFDAAVASMALMDMAEIEPLFRALRHLLKPGRPFVFSVMHPCFNTSATTFMAEEVDQEGVLVTHLSLRVSRYLGLQPTLGLGIYNQPVPHRYFHRPLQTLLGAAFQAGFVLDGLEEPAFGPENADPQRLLSWSNFTEIPPALVCRVRGA